MPSHYPRRTSLALGTVAVALVSLVMVLRIDRRPGLPDGPLGQGGSTITICVPQPIVGAAFTFGEDVLSNSSSTPVTVDSFTLYQASGLHLVGAAIVPFVNNPPGAVAGYPPADFTRLQGYFWNERMPVGKALLLPAASTGDRTYSLSVGLARDSSATGISHGFELHYHSVTGRHYTLRTQDTIELPPLTCPEAPGNSKD